MALKDKLMMPEAMSPEEEMPMEEEIPAVDLASVSDEDLLSEVKKRGLSLEESEVAPEEMV